MRLHLIIFRHDLPSTRILWTTPATPPLSARPSAASLFTASFNTAQTSFTSRGSCGALGHVSSGYTVAQLLQDVNEVVPLETQPDSLPEGHNGGHWGLEDYAVELLGSECLHFMEVDALLRDGDEVVVRPLEIDDLTARQMTGRHQITPDGSYLIDGVPFGKRYVQRSAPSRPPIAIPPRKRRRIDQGDREDEQSVMSANYSMGGPGREHETGQENRIETVDTASRNGQDPAYPLVMQQDRDEAGRGTALHAQSTETYEQPKEPEKNIGAAKVVATSPFSSDSSEGQSSDSSSAVSSVSDDSSSLSSSDESSDSESDVESQPKKEPSKYKNKSAPKAAKESAPGKGCSRTRNNNLRCKLRRRLEKMKAAGVLHENANFADLRAWDEGQKGNGVSKVSAEVTYKASEGEQEESDFEKRRAQLLRDLEEGGVEVSPASAKNKVPTVLTETKEPDSTSQNLKSNGSAPATSAVGSPSDIPTPKRQAKLDMAGARRLLFGSLGVRTPKTKEDEEHTRNKLAAKSRNTKSAPEEPQETPKTDTQALEPVENWQDFIDLRATECVYENVELSAPPFPFVQRWNGEDQEAIRMHRRNITNNGSRGKKRKRKSRISAAQAEAETNDAYDAYEEYGDNNDHTNGDLLLDYGEDENASSRAGAANGAVLPENTTGTVPDSASDDLPLLPDDISSLAPVEQDKVAAGAVIAFKQLDMSKETGWQPIVSDYRTAVVEEVSASLTLRIRLAKRDRAQQPASSDESDSPRIYSKFEMPGYDEGDDEDDGIREIPFDGLIEPKLLRPGGSEPDISAEEFNETPNACLTDRVPDSVPTENVPAIPTPISSQTRNDISNIIREAGFRSTIDSDLYGPEDEMVVSETRPPKQVNENSDASKMDSGLDGLVVGSPRFSGFKQSPVPEISVSYPENNSDGADSPQIASGEGRESQFSVGNNSDGADSHHVSSGEGKETQISVPVKSNCSSSHIPGQQLGLSDSLSLMPSDDGLTYLTETDITTGLRGQTDGQVDSLEVPHKSSPPSFQPDQDDLSQDFDLSQDLSQFSSLPQTVQDSRPADGRPVSNASSTVPNPFYDVDRRNAAIGSGSSSDPEAVASTAPARISTVSKLPSPEKEGKWEKRTRRGNLESKREKRMEAKETFKRRRARLLSSSPNAEIGDDSSESPAASTTEAQPDEQPESTMPASQVPEGSLLVDLTFSSDPESPGNSDGDYAKSQGLPHGPGWVAKGRPRGGGRSRSTLSREDAPPSRRGNTRGRLRRSVI